MRSGPGGQRPGALLGRRRHSRPHLLGTVLVAPSQTLLQLVPLPADALQVLLQLPPLPQMPTSVSASRAPGLLHLGGAGSSQPAALLPLPEPRF